MKYIIDDEELRAMLICFVAGNSVNQHVKGFLKNILHRKKVKVIAEGIIKHITKQVAEEEWEFVEAYLKDTVNNKNIGMNEILPYEFAIRNEGKQVKLLLEVINE